ncbi:MAG: DUF3047 domain-containing protein, partial [bacterium]
MKNSINMISIIFLLLSYHSVTNAQVISSKLLGDFQEDWKKHWIERNLFQLPKQYHGETGLSEKSTPYRVVEDKHNLVLKVESNESTTALWRMLNIHPVNFGRIKWRWKVDRSLSHNKRERQKVGDDYAARLFVVFEPHLLSWKTRALCYVWAGKEPVGSIYKNPYAKSVGTIVIESGNDGTGKWMSEQRNFVMD